MGSVDWKTGSNVFAACGSDRKVSLHDARSGVCAHVYHGAHAYAYTSFSKLVCLE